MREKCPTTEFFWSIFSPIWTEYGDLRSNSDQKNSVFEHFSRSINMTHFEVSIVHYKLFYIGHKYSHYLISIVMCSFGTRCCSIYDWHKMIGEIICIVNIPKIRIRTSLWSPSPSNPFPFYCNVSIVIVFSR